MTFDYRIGDRILRVVYADITELQVDAIVSSDGTDLSMSGGVSASIAARAGAHSVATSTSFAPCDWAR